MNTYHVEVIEKRIYRASVNAEDEEQAKSHLLNHPDLSEQIEPPTLEQITATLIRDE